MNKRTIGYAGEKLVWDHYLWSGYQHVMSNFTIRGGEIDIIMENADTTVFIEVKVVNHIDDIFDYVTEKKLYFLRKTIAHYCQQNTTKALIRVDVVFVKDGKIWEIYENIGS